MRASLNGLTILSPVPFGAAKSDERSSYHCSDTASQSQRCWLQVGMSDDERGSFDKLPKVLVFDGDAEGYLDADEAYQRWARRHYKGGLDKWIYGGKCPIKPGMDQAEIARICARRRPSL